VFVENNRKKKHEHLPRKEIENQLIVVMPAQDEKYDRTE